MKKIITLSICIFSLISCTHTQPKIAANYVTSIGRVKDEIKVVVVKGTPYEMGLQLGTLLKGDIKSTLNNFYEAAQKEAPNLPVEKILDEAWKTNSKYIDPRIIDEMKGVADGSGASLKLLHRCHMIPLISPYSCSGMSVWGDATKNGHIYQIRNLDYSVTSKLQEHPVIVIYIPTKGTPHANITFAGYVGSHTGINANHIVFGEIGESKSKEMPYDLNGTHFSFLFRTLEYDAKTLDGALQTIKKTPLIKRYYLFVSDGNQKTMGAAKIRVSTPDPIKLTIWKDNNPSDNVAPNIFSKCVYRTMNNVIAQKIIKKYLGKFDEKSMIELSKAVAAKHNLMNVVYDATTLEMWIAYANGLTNASEQNYIYLNMNDYLVIP